MEFGCRLSSDCAIEHWLQSVPAPPVYLQAANSPRRSQSSGIPPLTTPLSLKDEHIPQRQRRQGTFAPLDISKMAAPSDDGVSTTSFSTSAFDVTSRPKLQPKSPSKKPERSRSPSPTRKLFGLLEQAQPPTKFCQPGPSVEQPAAVEELNIYLSQDIKSEAIPVQLKVRYNLTLNRFFESVLTMCKRNHRTTFEMPTLSDTS